MNMNDQEDRVVYESSARFDENRIRAAAVYCSDGRFGEHFDDFLHNYLKLPHTTVPRCREVLRAWPVISLPFGKRRT